MKFTEALGNATFENYIGMEQGLSEMAYQIVSHVLTLGYAAMLAGLFYFILTIKYVAPKYRISSVLSVVVMTSAFLLLYKQSQNWITAFQFDTAHGLYLLTEGVRSDNFNNGYRYLNWLIDVPMLLFQILFVVSLVRSNFAKIRNQFWISGSLMIITGYIGQFYEVTNLVAFAVWGAISTAFFVHILILMKKVISEGKEGLSAPAKKTLGSIWTIFLISWFLYPGAYLMPHLLGVFNEAGLYNEAGVVGRQLTYTVADILSKVIYGVLLTVLATQLSKEEGYEYNALKS